MMTFMRIYCVIFLLFISTSKAQDKNLTVYTYSSLTGKGSLAELLQKEWESSGNKVKFIAFSTSGEMLNQILLEKEKTQADLVLGIDQLGIAKAQNSGYFLKENLSALSNQFVSEVPSTLLESGFVPFDFGYLALVYDSSRVKGKVSDSFSGFLKQNESKKNTIFIDPRTSQLGMSLLAWTKLIWKDAEWEKNMKILSTTAKLWAPGWSAAYSLFQKGEAEYVLSYTTSPAYHIEEEKKDQFKTITFKEGHFQQIESASIVKTSKKQSLARDFLKILVSKRVQDKIPQLQWMYPVVKNTTLPAAYSKLEKVKLLSGNMFVDEKTQKTWLNNWNELILSSK